MKGYKDPLILRNLYINRGLSIVEIAKLFKVNPKTIWYWLIKCGIPRRKPRSKRANNITKEQLEKLYFDKGLSVTQIAKKLNIRSNTNVLIKFWKYRIPIRDWHDANVYFHTKYPKISFLGSLKEKAYLIGLRIGDLYACKHHGLIRVQTTSSKVAQIKMFKKVFEKYGHVGIYENRKIKETTAYIHLNDSFNFLLKKKTNIPKWLLKNDGYFYSFLAGYSDAESCWSIERRHKNSILLRFLLVTCDIDILKDIKKKLIEKGFTVHLNLSKNKGFKTNLGIYKRALYSLSIAKKEDVIRIAKILLPLSRHEDKIKRMKLISQIGNKKWNEVKDDLSTP